MLRVLLLAVGILVTVSAGAKEKPEEILKELPEVIGGVKREKEIHTFPHAALGASAAYGAGDLQITVYVYDHGLKEIEGGVDHPGVRKSFEMAKRDIRQSYEDITTMTDAEAVLRNGEKVLSAEYRLTFPDKGSKQSLSDLRVYSSIHLGVAREHIVKVRTTASVAREEDARKEAKSFVDELFARLKGEGGKAKSR